MAEREHRGLVFTPLMVTDMERRTHAEALTVWAMARGAQWHTRREHVTRTLVILTHADLFRYTLYCCDNLYASQIKITSEQLRPMDIHIRYPIEFR